MMVVVNNDSVISFSVCWLNSVSFIVYSLQKNILQLSDQFIYSVGYLKYGVFILVCGINVSDVSKMLVDIGLSYVECSIDINQ